MKTIERATMNELPAVLQLLNRAREWMHFAGIEQWPREFTAGYIGPHVALAQTWLVREDGRPVATIRISPDADPAFWTPAEASDLALYVSALAVDQPGQHTGLGALLLRWAGDHAARLGYPQLRLDARRDNPGLHAYYARRGWRYLRTVEAPGRFSGALFDKPTALDETARNALAPAPAPRGWLATGTRVRVPYGGGYETGAVTAIDPGWDEYPEVRDEDPGLGRMPGYLVQLDSGRQVTVERGQVRAVQAASAA